MPIPQITFRHVASSPALEAEILDRARKLERLCDRIVGCRVTVEAPQHRHRKGNLYHLRIDVTLPGEELVATRGPSRHHAHEDAYVAIRDAFDAMERELESYVRRRTDARRQRPALRA
jgi:ribosomal subunit interface protein